MWRWRGAGGLLADQSNKPNQDSRAKSTPARVKYSWLNLQTPFPPVFTTLMPCPLAGLMPGPRLRRWPGIKPARGYPYRTCPCRDDINQAANHDKGRLL